MRKDSLVPKVEWAKHLRPFNKRRQAKKERVAWKAEISGEGKSSQGRKKKGKKRWGIKTIYSKTPDNVFGWLWNDDLEWFHTERSRDDAYNHLVKQKSMKDQSIKNSNEKEFGHYKVRGVEFEKVKR